jgi:DNA (cytosine-5)-methyltransferase 1
MFTYEWNLKDLKKVKKNGFTVFSCFAGGGGSSQGYKMAGYDVIGNNEIDPRQMEIYRHNLKPKFSYLEDIRTFRLREDLPEELFKLDILDASFPCSLFSSANLKADDKKGKEVKFREGQAKQRLDDLAFETIALVNKIKPKICVFENVKGLLQDKNKWYVQQIYKQFDNIGYRICHHLVNCADLGVPQKRQRVFFFAVRNDVDVPTADIFGTEPLLDLNIKEKHIQFKEIQDNQGKKVTGKSLELWENRKRGDIDLSFANGRLYNKPNSFFSHKYIYGTDIANTIVSADNCIVFDTGRYRGDLELKKCGSWSLDYDFMGQEVKYVVGMSVPPLAMYRIAKEIEKQWL